MQAGGLAPRLGAGLTPLLVVVGVGLTGVAGTRDHHGLGVGQYRRRRGLAEHARTEAYPEAVEQAHAEYASLPAADRPDAVRPRSARLHERGSDAFRTRLQTQQRP